MILDEYDQMDSRIWTEVLFPAINQSGGWVIFIGTFKGKGQLYNLFSKYFDWAELKALPHPDYSVYYLPYNKNPFFTEEQIRSAQETMPPAQFDQEYGCIPMSGSSSVFPSLTELMTGELKEPVSNHFYSMGLDLAKSVDYTAVSIIDKNTFELVYQDRWQSDWSATMEKVVAIRNRYNKAQLTIDSTGVGDPISELLKRRGVRTDDFKFSNAKKDQLVRKLGVYFSEKKLSLPPQDQIPNLVNELEQYSYEILPSGKIRYTAPDVLPWIRTYASMISDLREDRHEQEQAQRSADYCCAQAGGSGAHGGRRSPGVRRIQAHDLCLEGKVRRHGRQ